MSSYTSCDWKSWILQNIVHLERYVYDNHNLKEMTPEGKKKT